MKYGNTSDDMVNLMRQGGGTLYDGVSASGDASNRLIAGGDVAAIDTSMFPDYADVMPSLQSPAHNTVERAALRRPVHVGPEPAPVQHRRREAGAHQLGCPSSTPTARTRAR